MVIGILIANCLGKPLGGYDSWRILLGATVVPALLQLTFAPFLPESPRWLVSRGRKEEAEVVLSNLRGGNSAVDEHTISWLIEAMEHSFSDIDLSKTGVSKRSEGVCSASLRKPLIIGLVLQFAQQLSGINAVFYYSTSFFERAHFRDPWLGSVLAAFVNVVATGVAVRLMDQVGRRLLLLVSSLGMCVAALMLTWALQLTEAHPTSVVLGYGSVISVLLFVTLFELGLGPIPWLITAEIFPSSAASTCMTITCSANWIFNFCVGLMFPTMQAHLETYVFVPFGAVCLLCFGFTLVYVPETRGKSLDQIQADLRGHAFPGLSA
jgi:SP family facilitated glucose transporter-like MFS transporter 3